MEPTPELGVLAALTSECKQNRWADIKPLDGSKEISLAEISRKQILGNKNEQ